MKIIEDNKATFEKDALKKASSSALGLFNWIDKTIAYYQVIKEVIPLEKKVAEMTEKLKSLREDLAATIELVTSLEIKLKDLRDQ